MTQQMTGQQHYERAAQFAAEADSADDPRVAALVAAIGQVHATLALASATALAGSNDRDGQIVGYGTGN